MKAIVKYFVRKYAVKAVNDLLTKHVEDVAGKTKTVEKWSSRLVRIVELLRKTNGRLEDGVLDADEMKTTVGEIETLIKEF